jgi:hypothetical protein
MKHFLAMEGLILASSLDPGLAQTSATTNATAPSASPASGAPVAPRPVIFHPPGGVSGGILPIRVGGGSRGGAAVDLSVEVLVPDELALTTQAQPSLYWYQSKAAKTLCEVTVTEPKNPKPLLLLKTGNSTPEGIHAIRLTKFKINLKPNVTYRWSVAVVIDPANRSQDIVANGVIKRIDPSPDLASKLSAASEADKPALYAENGIWYDALQSISDQIDHAPQDQSLRQERADLLKQVGMNGVKMDGNLSKSP